MRRSAFTLMEMMVSITILSIMMLFLYKSYADLHKSNAYFKDKSEDVGSYMKKKQTLFLDFTLAHFGSIRILNQDTKEDVVFLQSSHSLYGRINPYIAYIKKEEELYRLESLEPFVEYPLESRSDFFGESLGQVKSFRLYTTQGDEKTNKAYLVHVDFIDEEDILYKINPLNEY